MEKVYVFKVALKYRKGLWRRIEIKGDQTLADFDHIIRIAFDHDTWDHLSEFFMGEWSRGGFGEIDPDGGGSGAEMRIEQLGLSEGDKLGYVYDFGDEIQHIITLEKIRSMRVTTLRKYSTERVRNKDMKAPSPNRAYLATCLRHFAQICSAIAPQTLHIPGTLGDMA